MQIDHSTGGVCVVALAGELDMSTIPGVESRLFRELRNGSTMVVDLTRLSFIDSSGIGLLIKAHQSADGTGLNTVVAPGSQVDRVFGLAGIDRALRLFSDRDRAIAGAGTREA
jgi:anti-anti-sigma factor